MSLARTALRLAAVEALSPHVLAETGPWPTIAGPRVYDTRITLIQEGADLGAIEGKPLLIVYTEEDTVTPYGQAKYPAEEQVVHLVVEALIAAKAEVEIDLGGGETATVGAIVAAPITTLQQELLIDLLEDQVRVALDPESRAVGSAALYRSVAMERRMIESFPQRADDRATRLNARTIKLHVKVKKAKHPQVPASAELAGFDLLPEPLRTVAKSLPATSPGADACRQVLTMLRPPAPLVPLELVGIGVVTTVDGAPAVINSVAAPSDDPGAEQVEPVDPRAPAAPAS